MMPLTPPQNSHFSPTLRFRAQLIPTSSEDVPSDDEEGEEGGERAAGGPPKETATPAVIGNESAKSREEGGHGVTFSPFAAAASVKEATIRADPGGASVPPLGGEMATEEEKKAQHDELVRKAIIEDMQQVWIAAGDEVHGCKDAYHPVLIQMTMDEMPTLSHSH